MTCDNDLGGYTMNLDRILVTAVVGVAIDLLLHWLARRLGWLS